MDKGCASGGVEGGAGKGEGKGEVGLAWGGAALRLQPLLAGLVLVPGLGPLARRGNEEVARRVAWPHLYTHARCKCAMQRDCSAPCSAPSAMQGTVHARQGAGAHRERQQRVGVGVVPHQGELRQREARWAGGHVERDRRDIVRAPRLARLKANACLVVRLAPAARRRCHTPQGRIGAMHPPRRSDGARWHEAQARPCELDTDKLTQQSRRTPLALVVEVGAGGQQVLVREANLRGGVGRVR